VDLVPHRLLWYHYSERVQRKTDLRAAVAACCHRASALIVNVLWSSGYVQAASANLQNKLFQKKKTVHQETQMAKEM
jgi:hypothetical protein